MTSTYSAVISPTDAQQQRWDAIVIGGGMGGGTAAYKLAKHDKKVLLIEKGLSQFSRFSGVEVEEQEPQERLESGKWPTQLTACVDNNTANLWAPLGCGTGGSSLLYAAALQRLRAEDFGPQALPNGETIEWPFSYEKLEPYYLEAETLFSVCGTVDPLTKGKEDYALRSPPAMCEADQHFFQEFSAAGLHPHRLHTAIKYFPDCQECGGHICQQSCKQDANNACIQPAIETGNLFILDQTEVLSLDADKQTVQSVTVKNHGSTYELNATAFIVAAGAYFTPVLLQNSLNDHWPKGLANQNDLVGRNLMFHASDFIAFWPRHRVSREGNKKTIAVRDFYRHDSQSLGEFQSTGLAAGYGNIVYALRLLFDQSPLKKLTPLRHFLRIPAKIAEKLFGEATIFTTIVEDYPYPENRVLADSATPSGMRFEYHIHDEFRERVIGFKQQVRKALSNLRSLPMAPGVSLNYGHPCGTCRAGDNPQTSVVDANCKAHGLDNLYIADASFMPTSGGTNPSLTIAANALRVADKINQTL